MAVSSAKRARDHNVETGPGEAKVRQASNGRFLVRREPAELIAGGLEEDAAGRKLSSRLGRAIEREEGNFCLY